MKEWRGWNKVFCFTFAQHIRTKQFKNLTIILALLCFILPAGIMALVQQIGSDDTESTISTVQTVYTVDLTDPRFSYDILNQAGNPSFLDIEYVRCSDLNKAIKLANENAESLILLVEENPNDEQEGAIYRVLLPNDSDLSRGDAEDYESFLKTASSLILSEKMDLDIVQLLTAMTEANTAEEVTQETEEGEASPQDPLKEILLFVLPYLNIMLLYFLILFYGQGLANNIIAEKTSKLMDTMLVSIKPKAMIFGKVLAMVVADIMQFVIWMFALILGFAAGTAIVKSMDPNTDMALVLIFDNLHLFGGLFSIGGIVLGVLITCAGFFLYSSLAAIGGAIAGKTEDLSSSNVLFVMPLLISFFVTLSSGVFGGIEGEAVNPIINWVPFTATLIAPANMMLGEMPLWQGLAVFVLTVVCATVILAFAGKIYHILALFKGDMPSIKKLRQMIKES